MYMYIPVVCDCALESSKKALKQEKHQETSHKFTRPLQAESDVHVALQNS